MGLSVAYPANASGLRRFDVIARSESGEPAGTMSVIETSGELALHGRYGLTLPQDATVARYAQLAVRKQFRGFDIPALMIVKAHECFVQPEGFDFSWLLFPARRAAASFLCRRLGFHPEPLVAVTEYGHCRALVRDEHLPAGHDAIAESARHLRLAERVRFTFAPQAACAELRI